MSPKSCSDRECVKCCYCSYVKVLLIDKHVTTRSDMFQLVKKDEVFLQSANAMTNSIWCKKTPFCITNEIKSNFIGTHNKNL